MRLLIFIIFLSVIFSSLLSSAATPDTGSVHFRKLTIIKGISITGNKITREHIIYRELMFRLNDTITDQDIDSKISRSRDNLLNTSLFNFVTITKTVVDSSDIYINIDLLERWYIWPVPIIELSLRNFNSWWQSRNFNRLNYGFSLQNNNFRGRKESLNILIKYGYDENYNISYYVPFIDRKQTFGLGFNAGIARNREIPYATPHNKLEYYRNNTDYPLTKFYSSIQITERHDIYNTHLLELGLTHYYFNDTINILNADFSPQHKNPEYLTLHYKFKNDCRDSKNYPLTGHYFDFDIYKFGLGFETKTPDLTFIHSSYNKYIRLSDKYYFAAGLLGGAVNKRDQPYYLASSVGYGHDNIRGYDYYVINGQYFGILKLNLKYELLPTHVHDFRFIPTEKFSKVHYAFYLNIFADGGYVYDDHFFRQNSLANQMLYSAGAGIDFVTYYDKVLRVEYTFNKLNQSGFFINFIAPI